MLFFFLLAASEFADHIENTFDLTRCTSYFLAQPIFGDPVQQLDRYEMTLYAPYDSWNPNRYIWEVQSEKKTPEDQDLECLVVTNGHRGKQLFFEALQMGVLNEWHQVQPNYFEKFPSFSGYMNADRETFVLTGLYKELSPHPLIGNKFTVCGIGAPYVQTKERSVHDAETRQNWQKHLGKGSIVVIYPAEGIPFESSQYARAAF